MGERLADAGQAVQGEQVFGRTAAPVSGNAAAQRSVGNGEGYPVANPITIANRAKIRELGVESNGDTVTPAVLRLRGTLCRPLQPIDGHQAG